MSESGMKKAEYWLRCGECLHFVTYNHSKYWCTNRNCPQYERDLSMTETLYHDQYKKLTPEAA